MSLDHWWVCARPLTERVGTRGGCPEDDVRLIGWPHPGPSERREHAARTEPEAEGREPGTGSHPH
ncbi:hypothetical protein SAMN04515680_3121 [Leifsonia sp. 21MFCrub1.1]|nr:hypothetical protein SAMN04515680_3121 [Leifsonia sp. 21MFCrub1.1]